MPANGKPSDSSKMDFKGFWDLENLRMNIAAMGRA